MNSIQINLTKELEAFSQQRGADLFGVADLTPAHQSLSTKAPFHLSEFPRAVSIGMQLNDIIVERHSPEEKHRESLYWHHVYNVVSPKLDFIAYDLARWLAAKNFKTFPIPASMPYNMEKLEGIFSHKLAAHLAGLGWIGKSSLLLTDDFGPRVRFVSLLTDAPLETGLPLDRPCGSCHVCVDSCPVGAFTGVEFKYTDNLEIRFDAPKCSLFRRDHPCGLCVSSCPKGRKRAHSLKVRDNSDSM